MPSAFSSFQISQVVIGLYGTPALAASPQILTSQKRISSWAEADQPSLEYFT